jgi:hypothetical protein
MSEYEKIRIKLKNMTEIWENVKKKVIKENNIIDGLVHTWTMRIYLSQEKVP